MLANLCVAGKALAGGIEQWDNVTNAYMSKTGSWQPPHCGSSTAICCKMFWQGSPSKRCKRENLLESVHTSQIPCWVHDKHLPYPANLSIWQKFYAPDPDRHDLCSCHNSSLWQMTAKRAGNIRIIHLLVFVSCLLDIPHFDCQMGNIESPYMDIMCMQHYIIFCSTIQLVTSVTSLSTFTN